MSEITRDRRIFADEQKNDQWKLAAAMARSGFFANAKSASQAFVKIVAGHEIGIGTIEAMSGLHIVKGNITIGYKIIAAKIKESGKYDYRVLKHNDLECVLEFFDPRTGETLGESSFTVEDAKRAGLGGDNWAKYPRNMLFARAVTNGHRFIAPDLFTAPVYEYDEMGLNVDGQGNVIDAEVVVAAAPELEELANEIADTLPVEVEPEPVKTPAKQPVKATAPKSPEKPIF